MTRDGDLLVRNATVWSGGSWAGPRDISVRDGRISSIAPPGETVAAPGIRTLNATGCHALPGFINTHTHLFQALLRGVADGKGLGDWLLAVTGAYIAADPEQAYVAAACAAAEALRSGATTIVEHGHPHPNREFHEAIITAVDDVGVRAVYCRGVADRADPAREWGFEPRLLEPYEDQLAHVEELAVRFSVPGSRLTAGLAAPNPRSLSPDGMRGARELSDRYGLCVSVHVCETGLDDRACLAHTGKRALPYLDEHDFLWDRFLGVHCVQVLPEHRALMAARRCGVSYNPISNLRLGSGFAPIPEFLNLDVQVGLGVDGAASNDTQDMFEAIRYGAYVQRGRLADADALSAQAMLRMATTGCNSVIGVEPRPKGLQPGLQADMLLIRFDRDLSSVPFVDPTVTLLTQATSRTVEAVVVGGEVVVENGRCTRVDEEDLIRRMVHLGASSPFRGIEGDAVRP